MIPIGLVLAIPIVPFLIFGEKLEARITGWLGAELSPKAATKHPTDVKVCPKVIEVSPKVAHEARNTGKLGK